MIKRSFSLVVVDKRRHRKIAQSNWGLSDAQMNGMHVHHRIPVSEGGTNDPSNLYVCSPSFHRWVWHNGEAWIEWAQEGSRKASASRRHKRETDPEWVEAESRTNSLKAKKSHEYHKNTREYSDRQRVKSMKSHINKRKNWSEEVYDYVWNCYVEGVTSGYLISRRCGEKRWRRYANMLRYASMGFSFTQLTNIEEYVKETDRLKNSPIAHILDRYDD